MAQIIYKIMNKAQWTDFSASGVFAGAPIDIADGYVHLSTASQMRETAAKYFAGQDDLMLIAVASEGLGDALKFEVSRGDDLFPHLYAPLTIEHVLWAKPLPLDASGTHEFPETSQ